MNSVTKRESLALIYYFHVVFPKHGVCKLLFQLRPMAVSVKCSGSGLCSSRARVPRQPSRRPPAHVLPPARPPRPPPARCPGRGPRHAWARCPPRFTVHRSFSPGLLAFRCSNPLRHAHAAAFSSPLVLVTQRQLVLCMQEPRCPSQAGSAPRPAQPGSGDHTPWWLGQEPAFGSGLVLILNNIPPLEGQ